MKRNRGGPGALCYLAVFLTALLALPALLWLDPGPAARDAPPAVCSAV